MENVMVLNLLEIDPCGCMFEKNITPDEVPGPISEGMQKIGKIVKEMKRGVTAMKIALEKPECPRKAKVLTSAALIYLACPIDLIPDFIPVLGYLDDVVIVGGLLWAARKSIPDELWKQCQAEARAKTKQKKDDWRAFPVFAALWVGAAAVTFKVGMKYLPRFL
jgi:uncharacterized membrane protein YkvA (DUF1232 family)